MTDDPDDVRHGARLARWDERDEKSLMNGRVAIFPMALALSLYAGWFHGWAAGGTIFAAVLLVLIVLQWAMYSGYLRPHYEGILRVIVVAAVVIGSGFF